MIGLSHAAQKNAQSVNRRLSRGLSHIHQLISVYSNNRGFLPDIVQCFSLLYTKRDSNGGVQDGELTYNHINKMWQLCCGERAAIFMRIEYKNICDSSERQATVKRLITRDSSLYELFGTCYSLKIMLSGTALQNF